ncbi:F-box/kelch-repeat protein At1g51550 [Amborella trichopoda]|uniref:F-box domain-containing protein n=1 Tax=Amborella trichopoda TaxID=13333 RepID=W1PWD3_AMBTC|nr:F-box/kelch-repeat protein At1g51550 [Amborella trichopoda]ERN12458.1 hypothetical protein AMTR_s00025p00153820 [Amborella trichopoda]|eukprot:XP_006850877.1 F-box/kelch-repeat protein At1g51550 [Amborella trichopoda]
MDKCYISSINSDLLQSILQLLPLPSLLSFSMTCKSFNSIASSDSLWEQICIKDWGNHSFEALLSSSLSTMKPNWKNLYKKVRQLSSLQIHRLNQDHVCPPPRASHTLNLISDSLVLFGGGCEGGRHLDDTWLAHIGGRPTRGVIWQKISSGIPSGRFGQTCCNIDNALILFGGINENGARQNDTWVCHILPNLSLSWTPLDVGPPLPPPRGAHASCYAGPNRMVIHGGIDLDGLRLGDTWLLDLSNGWDLATWRKIMTLPPSPSARSGHTITWIGGGRMVLFGGRGPGFEVLNDLWLLDIASEAPEWVELMNYAPNVLGGLVPSPRVGHSATLVLGGRILIYGGEDSYRRRNDDLWVLDPNAIPTIKARVEISEPTNFGGRKVWKKLRPEGHIPSPRSFHRACADESMRHVYVFGGMVDGLVQPSEAFGLIFDAELHLVELVL